MTIHINPRTGVSNRAHDDPLIRRALKDFSDPLVVLADNLDRMRVIQADFNKAGTYTAQLPPETPRMQLLNRTRTEEGNPQDIERDTVVVMGSHRSSKLVLTHELRHRGLAILRERIPWADFKRRYINNVDLFTQREAWKIYQESEESFVNSFDQDTPDEPNVDNSTLVHQFRQQDVRTQTALGNLEQFFLMAAKDLLIEDGRRGESVFKIPKRGWLAKLFRRN